MPHSFHIEMRVKRQSFQSGIRPFPNGNYNVSMIDRIGPKRPSRLEHSRAWDQRMNREALDQRSGWGIRIDLSSA